MPLLVLRDKTERPEAIATGNMRLIGTDPGRIVAEVTGLLGDPVRPAAMSVPAFPYGDGSAGRRIAAIIDEWLAARSLGGRAQHVSASAETTRHSGGV